MPAPSAAQLAGVAPIKSSGAPTPAELAGVSGTQGPVASSHSSGGGLLGFVHDVGNIVGGGTRAAVGDALGKVADTTEGIGTGIYQLAKASKVPQTLAAFPATVAEKPSLLAHPEALAHSYGQHLNTDLFGGSPSAVLKQYGNVATNPVGEYKAEAKTDPFVQDVAAMGKQTLTSLEHPGRDPFQTALTAATLLSAGAGGAARLAYAARALDAARVGSTGELVVTGSDAAKAALAAGDTVTPLTNAEKVTLIRRAGSPGYKPPTTQRFLNQPVAKLVHPAVEGERAEGPAAVEIGHKPVQLQASGSHLYRGAQGVGDKVMQKALDNGVTAARQTRTAKFAERRIAGALGESERISRNVAGAEATRVARSMENLDKGVPRRVGQLATFLRSANVTGEEASKYWADQAAKGIGDRVKLGPGAGQRATVLLSKLAQRIHDQGLLKVGDDGNVVVDEAKFPKLAVADKTVAGGQATREGILGDKALMTPEGLQTRLNLVAQRMGVDREGQGFTSLKTESKRSAQSPVARSNGTVIPLTKRLSLGKTATGAGVAKGLIPANTALVVARGLHDALRFVSSDRLRGRVAKLGSDIKRTGDDILARDPESKTQAEIPQDVKEMLGRSESTLTEAEHDTFRTAARKLLEDHIPGLKDNFEADRAAGLGTRAPEGYKWVPKQVVPDDLTSSVEARGKVEKFADAVNSAVTSATVYFKLGHLPTRLLTNLSTNLVQGSLAPGELRATVSLANDLSDAQKMDLTAATGTHGYQALPHAGTTRIAKIAGKGANAWARHIDAPFRLNAVLYELRQVGYDTPALIDKAIGHLKDQTRDGMDAASASKLDWAVRRANRASIMYDGLSAAEKRYVARYLWFFPWVKGAARFVGHTIEEHPFKAEAISQTGVLGARDRQNALGTVPPYEFGLTPLTGGQSPLTSNFSSFTPFSTAGNVAQLIQHPLNPDQGVEGQMNPFYAAITTLLTEAKEGKPHALRDALTQAVSPTPELQAVNAFRHPPGPTKMFGATNLGTGGSAREKALLSALARALGGTAVPRPTRKSALAKASNGYRTISIPKS